MLLYQIFYMTNINNHKDLKDIFVKFSDFRNPVCLVNELCL